VSWGRRFGGVAAFLAPILAMGAATMVYNHRTFGSLVRSGYHFWCPVPYDYASLVFSPEYLPENVVALLRSPFLPTLLLAVILIQVQRKSGRFRGARGDAGLAVAWFVALSGLPYLAIHLVYFFQDTRFFLPFTILVAVLAGGLAGGLLSRVRHAGLVAAAVLLAVAGGMRATHPPPKPFVRGLLAEAARRLPGDAIVVTATSPAYVEFALAEGTRRRVLPLDRSVEYASKVIARRRVDSPDPAPARWSDHRCAGLVRGGGEEAVAAVAAEHPDILEEALGSGTRVFMLYDPRGPGNQEAFASLAGRFRVRPAGERIIELVRPDVPAPTNGGGAHD
jgi:hypothetical protein